DCLRLFGSLATLVSPQPRRPRPTPHLAYGRGLLLCTYVDSRSWGCRCRDLVRGRTGVARLRRPGGRRRGASAGCAWAWRRVRSWWWLAPGLGSGLRSPAATAAATTPTAALEPWVTRPTTSRGL